MDNMVYSAPTVNGEIKGGKSQITGNFTVEEAFARVVYKPVRRDPSKPLTITERI